MLSEHQNKISLQIVALATRTFLFEKTIGALRVAWHQLGQLKSQQRFLLTVARLHKYNERTCYRGIFKERSRHIIQQ